MSATSLPGRHLTIVPGDVPEEFEMFGVPLAERRERVTEAAGESAFVTLHPMVGGVPPELAWVRLHLFEEEHLAGWSRFGIELRRAVSACSDAYEKQHGMYSLTRTSAAGSPETPCATGRSPAAGRPGRCRVAEPPSLTGTRVQLGRITAANAGQGAPPTLGRQVVQP